MSKEFELDAKPRADVGKGASRRLRREELVPAIIYGAKQDPVNVVLTHRQVMKALENEAFYSHILNLKVDGKAHQVILKDLQRHPFKRLVMHMDFQRITGNEILHRNVLLRFVGEELAPGIKLHGGMATHHLKEVEITCAVKDLPEYLEVDVSKLELNDVLHLSDIKAPKGVTITALSLGEDHDLPVVGIQLPRGAVEAAGGSGSESA